MKNKLVTPKTYLTGFTSINTDGLIEYLQDTDQTEFIQDIDDAKTQGLSEGEILCSFYAKMCYASLTTKKNKNISKIRGIKPNIIGTIESGHGCYDENTEVLTQDGWKYWPTVTEKDVFATMNSRGFFEWQNPKRVFKYNYVGKMISYDSNGVDLLVTPNHNMFVCNTTTKEGRKKCFDSYKLIKAEEIVDKSHAFLKALPKGPENEGLCPLHQLLGFAIGDGSISGNRLSFHLRKERKVSYLTQLCDDLGYMLYKKDDIYYINLENLNILANNTFRVIKEFNIKELFNQIYSEKEKVIPNIIFTSYFDNTLLLDSIFDGLINSDGSVSATGIVYDTTSKKLADGFQTLCNLLGFGCNISQAECYKERTHSFGEKPIYRSHVITRAIKPEFNKSSAEQYKKPLIIDEWSGDVYCVEVPNHILFVRRNGKSIWCGNSVFEHCSINFLTTNCSRVFTHELVRHRVGSAYSQTSGRYVRTDSIDFVHDPILDPVKHKIESALEYLQTVYQEMEEDMKLADIKDFAIKKKITSAMRRILPNGQANEIGFSLNLRSLRHLIELRTSVHAEWEIRLVFNQVFDLINEKYPAMFADVEKEWIDNAWQITFKNKKI